MAALGKELTYYIRTARFLGAALVACAVIIYVGVEAEIKGVQ